MLLILGLLDRDDIFGRQSLVYRLADPLKVGRPIRSNEALRNTSAEINAQGMPSAAARTRCTGVSQRNLLDGVIGPIRFLGIVDRFRRELNASDENATAKLRSPLSAPSRQGLN